jgi:nucleolar protein 6
VTSRTSAGGGGSKSETRKARIEEKNKKLNEERAKAAKDADKKKKKAEKKQEGAKMEDAGNGEAAEPAFGDIHPSRMNRFNK